MQDKFAQNMTKQSVRIVHWIACGTFWRLRGCRNKIPIKSRNPARFPVTKAGKPTSEPLIPAVNKYKAKTNEYVVSFVVIRD
jgi:hypothetical protein